MQLCCIIFPPHLIYSLFAPSKKCMILFPLLSRSHSVVLIYLAYDPVQIFTDGTESSGSHWNGCCLIPINPHQGWLAWACLFCINPLPVRKFIHLPKTLAVFVDSYWFEQSNVVKKKCVCDLRTKWVFHPSTVGGHSSKCFSSIKSIIYHTDVDIFFLWLEIY